MSLQSQLRNKSGFAVMLALSLLAFLFLLLISLSVFVQIEQRTAGNKKHQLQAQQNALLAMNLAIAKLQEHTGPDQRVTATADLQGVKPDTTEDMASGADLQSGLTKNTLLNLDTYWQSSRNRYWVGAWQNANNDPANYDPQKPSDYNPIPELKAWLVSGNEVEGDNYRPETQIQNFTFENAVGPQAPTNTLGTESSPYRLLVGSGSVLIESPADMDRAVAAPQVALTENSVTTGHYAWWVGDESIKARANLSDPYNIPTATATDNRIRLQSAQRTAIEAMTTDGLDGLALLDPTSHTDLSAFTSNLSSVLTPSQLAYMAPSPETFSSELKTHYHDFSIYSRGVLSDTKRGGLKTDLSYLFGQPDLDSFRSALNAAYGTDQIAPDGDHNQVFTPETTLYATFPSDLSAYYPFEEGSDKAGIFRNAPTWEQLWSFANMGNLTTETPAGVFTASGEVASRRHTADQHGIYPLLIQFKLFYRMRIVGGGDDLGVGDDVNRTGTIWTDVIPVILIANPYAVPLEAAEYQVEMDDERPPLIIFGTEEDDGSFKISNFSENSNHRAAPKKDDLKVVYNLRTNGMKPGEAQIFTIDETDPGITSHAPYSLIPYDTSKKRQIVQMKNDMDLLTGMTYNTGLSIPADKTHVALRGYQPNFTAGLYMDSQALTEYDHRYLIHMVRGQSTNLAENNSGAAFFVLNPMSDGIRQGGGYYLLLNQPPIDENLTTGNFAPRWTPQQAPFLQVNYRGMFVYFGGSDTGTGGQNAVEWARTFAKNGSNGLPGPGPSPWLEANLVREPGNYETARWGLFNMGEGSSYTEAPSYINDPEVGFQNLLYDIPRPDHPLASIGQLQHFNTTGFVDYYRFHLPDNSYRQARVLHSWQSSYAISNSYPQPRVTRELVFDWHNKMGRQFDGSYLWNDIFWDKFYFSTFPQSGSFDFEDPDDLLVNSRYTPFREDSGVANDDPENFRGDGSPETPENSRIASSNLLVDGAFNINSTSVEAWKAVFSSLKNVPIAGDNSPVAPYSRTLAPINDSTGASAGNTPNSWNGFYDFTDVEIQALAEEMVLQIHKRGPFTSLSEFVNRRLIEGRSSNLAASKDPMNLGISGPLQAALDAVVNQRDRIAEPFNVPAKRFVALGNNQQEHNATRDPDFRLSSGLAGMPGYVLQGDVLSTLGASLTPRSDTFIIRTYGDSVNPATAQTNSRAWLEAVVQRVPDYVESSLSAVDTPLPGSVNDRLGRQYKVISFRWLLPEEI